MKLEKKRRNKNNDMLLPRHLFIRRATGMRLLLLLLRIPLIL